MPEAHSWWICCWPAPGRALQTEESIPRPTPNSRREESHQYPLFRVFSGSFKSCFKVSRYYRGPRQAAPEMPRVSCHSIGPGLLLPQAWLGRAQASRTN